MKKVLFYNWVQFDDAYGCGGGVTTYLNGLISKLRLEKGVQCYFLSSGQSYTFDGELRIEETQNVFSPQVKSFRIVNSPIMSPASLAFDNIKAYLEDDTLGDLLYDFCKKQGFFDVIHFHNIEGLSLSVLKLKERMPQTKFVYTIHNYYFACPQVNLWCGESINCFTDPQFPDCAACCPQRSTQAYRVISGIKNILRTDDSDKAKWWYKPLKKAGNVLRKVLPYEVSEEITTPTEVNRYVDFRRKNCEALNQYFDQVLSVSKRTAEIAIACGIRQDLVQVAYIGTLAAEKQIKKAKAVPDDSITIGYLGYARKDKGFFFLLDALDKIKELPEAKRIKLIIAARACSEQERTAHIDRLNGMAEYFASVEYKDGYSKDEQAHLLERIDCSTVPVCWEDNLPQVSIETIAAGVPILVSQYGGAKELLTDEWFAFNSEEEFCRKMIELVRNPKRLESFFKIQPHLQLMDEHINYLLKLYGV